MQSYHCEIYDGFSLDSMFSYIESDGCSYVITTNSNYEQGDQFVKHMYDLANLNVYTKIEDFSYKGSQYITIWEHNI